MHQGLKKYTYIRMRKKRLIPVVNKSFANIRTNRKSTKIGKQKERKTTLLHILSDKLARLHMRRLGHGYERKTWENKERISLKNNTKQRHNNQLY